MALIKNSQISVIEPFDMNGYRVVEVANPITGSDSANKWYVDNAIFESASGDMLQSVYDVDGDGYVDSASFAFSASYVIGQDNLDNVAYTNRTNYFTGSQYFDTSATYMFDDSKGSGIYLNTFYTGSNESTIGLYNVSTFSSNEQNSGSVTLYGLYNNTTHDTPYTASFLYGVTNITKLGQGYTNLMRGVTSLAFSSPGTYVVEANGFSSLLGNQSYIETGSVYKAQLNTGGGQYGIAYGYYLTGNSPIVNDEQYAMFVDPLFFSSTVSQSYGIHIESNVPNYFGGELQLVNTASYQTDLSSVYNDRSLVDKGYVDSVTGSLSATATIGNPDDGTYTDGFFDFTSSTKISNAVDEISEAFLDLAPSKAELLTGKTLVNQNSVFSGRLSDGLNSEWYIGYSAGESVSTITSTTSVDLRTPSTSDTFRAGLKRDYTPTNNLTGGVTGSKILGVSESLSTRPYTDDTGTTGIINISDLAEYNTFWMKANAQINETLTNTDTGSLTYNVSATSAGTTNDYQLFYTGDATYFPNTSMTFGPSESLDNEVTMYLSGIQYYTSGSTFDIFYSGSNMYNPVYATGNQSLISSTYFTNVARNYDGTPNYDSVLSVSQSVTILSGYSSNWDNIGTYSVTLYKPNKSNNTNSDDLGNRPINSMGNVSTDLIEYFYDEVYRNTDESTDGWNSTTTLSDGNLQVQNGRLISGEFGDYPGNTGTEQEYHRKFIPQNSNGNGTTTIDRTGFSSFVEEYGNTNSELQVILRANSKIYDLGRAVGDNDVGSSIYGIRDSISGETITWALPTGDTVDNSNPFKMEIIFRNSTSSDYINEITMTFAQG